MCFLVLYLDPVFACICASNCSQWVWPTDCWDCQLWGPFNQLLVAVQSGSSVLSAECLIGLCAWKERGNAYRWQFFFFFFFTSAGSISAVNLTSPEVPDLNTVWTWICPLELTKIPLLREESTLPLFRILFSLRVCVCCFRERLPSHLTRWFAHSLMGWINASRNPGASEGPREQLHPNELVRLSRERADHTPGKRKAFLPALKNFERLCTVVFAARGFVREMPGCR